MVLHQFTKAHQLVGKSDRAIRDMIVLLHSAILEVRKYQVQNGVIGNFTYYVIVFVKEDEAPSSDSSPCIIWYESIVVWTPSLYLTDSQTTHFRDLQLSKALFFSWMILCCLTLSGNSLWDAIWESASYVPDMTSISLNRILAAWNLAGSWDEAPSMTSSNSRGLTASVAGAGFGPSIEIESPDGQGESRGENWAFNWSLKWIYINLRKHDPDKFIDNAVDRNLDMETPKFVTVTVVYESHSHDSHDLSHWVYFTATKRDVQGQHYQWGRWRFRARTRGIAATGTEDLC